MPKTIHKTKTHMIRLAIGLHTASQWHDSTSTGGMAMLSLSTTRCIHSEAHRINIIADIKANVLQVIEWSRHDDDDYAKDIQRLGDLWMLVNEAIIDDEWLTDHENMTINNMLNRQGKL